VATENKMDGQVNDGKRNAHVPAPDSSEDAPCGNQPVASTTDLLLRLLPHHLDHLRASGLSDDTIARAQFRSCTEPLGIEMPFFDACGKLTGYRQLRPDRPRKPGRKYEAPAGEPLQFYFSPIVPPHWWADEHAMLALTEGIKKALIVSQCGLRCVAAAGVYCFHDVDHYKRTGLKRLRQDLRRYIHRGQIVLILFDSDAVSNANVARAQRDLAKMLADEGALPVIVTTPRSPDGRKHGIDDYLAAHAENAVTALFELVAQVLVEREEVPLRSAQRRVLTAVRTLSAWLEETPGRLGVLDVVPPGVGKTYAALQETAAKERNGRSVRFLGPSHDQLAERESEYAALGGTEAVREEGVTRRCPRVGAVPGAKGIMESLMRRDWPVKPTYCEACSERGLCVAYSPLRRDGTHFAPHAMPVARRTGRRRDEGTPVAICDEMPSVLETERVELRDLEILTLERDGALGEWLSHRATIARFVLRAACIAKEANRGEYPNYYSGPALADLLARAVDELLPGWSDELEPWPGVGCWRAHDERCAPPFPPAQLIYDGRLKPEDWPRRDTDRVLDAVLNAGMPIAKRRGKLHGALVVEGEGDAACAWFEMRRFTMLDVLRRQSMLVLDATASAAMPELYAGMPTADIRVVRIRVCEPVGVKRRWYATSDLSGRSLFGKYRVGSKAGGAGVRLSGRGADAVELAIDLSTRDGKAGQSLGIITHRPLAEILRCCIRVLDGKNDDGSVAEKIAKAKAENVLALLRRLRDEGKLGPLFVAHYLAVRGSNAMADVDALLLLGEPIPNIGAVGEDARVLGLSRQALVESRIVAELEQAEGRARAVRRDPSNLPRITFVGRQLWGRWREDPNVEVLASDRAVSEAASAAGALVSLLRDRVGIAAWWMVREIASNNSGGLAWILRTAAIGECSNSTDAANPPSFPAECQRLARLAKNLGDSQLQRIVRRELPDDGWVHAPALAGRRSAGAPRQLWERSPGLARLLLTDPGPRWATGTVDVMPVGRADDSSRRVPFLHVRHVPAAWTWPVAC
jgi:hypothetical protein